MPPALSFVSQKTADNLSGPVNKQAHNSSPSWDTDLDLPRSEAVGSKAQAMFSSNASSVAFVKCPSLGDEKGLVA